VVLEPHSTVDKQEEIWKGTMINTYKDLNTQLIVELIHVCINGSHVMLHCVNPVTFKRAEVVLNQVARLYAKNDKMYRAIKAHERFEEEIEKKTEKDLKEKEKKKKPRNKKGESSSEPLIKHVVIFFLFFFFFLKAKRS
jgi:hypothetical protein